MAKDLEFIQRGKVLIVRRQFQEAVRVCRLGLLANPTLVEGRLVLGMALMALGRYDDVLAEMRVGLEIEPTNPLATLLKGEALFYKGDHEQAEEVLERARQLDPQSEKAGKLLTEIRLAREAGLSPEGPREVTDTKVYPAVADGVAPIGPVDLPEALPPPQLPGQTPTVELPKVAIGGPSAGTDRSALPSGAARSGITNAGLGTSAVTSVGNARGRAQAAGAAAGLSADEESDQPDEEERTEVDPQPAGAQAGAAAALAVPELVPGHETPTRPLMPERAPSPHEAPTRPVAAERAPSPNEAPTRPVVAERAGPIEVTTRPGTAEPEAEETPTTQPWVGSDKTGETDPTESEATPIKQPEIPPEARRPPAARTLVGIPSSVVVVPAVGKRPLPSSDGYEDTGQGDDYMDTTGGGGRAGKRARSVADSGEESSVSGISSVDTTAPTIPGPRSPAAEEGSEPTRPDSPHAVSALPPTIEPGKQRPPALPPAPKLQELVADFEEEASTVSRDTMPRVVPMMSGEVSFGSAVRLETPESPTAPRGPAALRLPAPAQPPSPAAAPSPMRPPGVAKPAGMAKLPAPVRPPSAARVLTDKVAPPPPAMASRWSRPALPVWTGAAGQWRLVLVASAGVVLLSIGLGFAIRAWRGHSEATRRREQAQKQIATGNLPGYTWAQRAYEQVLSAYPDDLDAMAGRALTLAAISYEFDEPQPEARAALEAVRKRAGAAGQPAVVAASVYLKLADTQVESAEKEARAAAAQFDSDALLAYLVGRAELSRGDASAAKVSFTNALRRDPHLILGITGLGQAEAMLGETEDALRDYVRALNENANHIATMVARARLRVAKGSDVVDAETDLFGVVKNLKTQASRAQVAWAQLSLAELFGNRGQVANAQEALEQARRGGPDKNAQFWEAAARAALKVYDVAGARKDAQKAVELAPNAPGGHMALAAALLESGEGEAALKELVGTAAPDTPDFLTLRGRARLAIGRVEEAKEDLEQAAARAQDLPEVEILRARIDLRDHNAGRAVDALRKLFERFPGRADVAELLGTALAERKDPAAKKTLEKAAELNPQAVLARVSLARLLRSEGRSGEAAERIREALKVRPNAVTPRELGEVLFETGDLLGAQRAFDAARASAPDDPRLLMAAARVAAAEGDQPTTERLVTQAVARGASPYHGWKVRARAALYAGRPRDAIPWARRAVSTSFEDADARALLILALAGDGRLGAARAFLRDSVKRLGGWRPDLLFAWAKIGADRDNPNLRLIERAVRAYRAARRPPRVLSDAYTLFGQALYHEGQIGRASAMLDQAIAYNHHNPKAYFQKGVVVSERDRPDEAAKLFDLATQFLPRVTQAFFELGRARQKNGDRAGAVKAYEDYLKIAPEGGYADEARKELESLKSD